jgi:hypothetical protein
MHRKVVNMKTGKAAKLPPCDVPTKVTVQPPANVSPEPAFAFPPHEIASPIRPMGLPFTKTEPDPPERLLGWGGAGQVPQACGAKASPWRTTGMSFTKTSGDPAMAEVGGKWQAWPVPISPIREIFGMFTSHLLSLAPVRIRERLTTNPQLGNC